MQQRKHALITGGNKGIGLETTKLLIAQGYNVTVLARNNSSIQHMDYCQAIDFDLLEIEKIAPLINKLEPIDVLINNAGIMHTYTYDSYPPLKKADMIRINLEAPVELITCIAPQMIERQQGRIVNNASIAGQIGHPDIWYGITKAGLINATKSFAKQLGSHHIIVNAVAPGPVETDMMQTIPQSRKDAILKTVYTGRFAQPSEVAKTISWLATESPEYINGICIDINNGAFPR